MYNFPLQNKFFINGLQPRTWTWDWWEIQKCRGSHLRGNLCIFHLSAIDLTDTSLSWSLVVFDIKIFLDFLDIFYNPKPFILIYFPNLIFVSDINTFWTIFVHQYQYFLVGRHFLWFYYLCILYNLKDNWVCFSTYLWEKITSLSYLR